jgi:hypothetical protein
MAQDHDNKPDFSDLAPALDPDPVFERPSGFEHAPPTVEQLFGPSPHAPSGAWADNRSSFGLEMDGGPGFLDPGTFALGRHRTDLMQAVGIAAGAVSSASAELLVGFGGDDDPKGKGKGTNKIAPKTAPKPPGRGAGGSRK